MKKSHLTITVILLILLVAVFTNPNLDRHKEVVKAEIHAYMQKNISADNLTDSDSEASEQLLGTVLGGALIDRIIDSVVSTDNYLFFSTTKVTWEGRSRIVGFGIFGNVYITNKVKEALSSTTN